MCLIVKTIGDCFIEDTMICCYCLRDLELSETGESREDAQILL